MEGTAMKQDFDEMHYYAGYPNSDSMREKAKRLMLEEMMHTQMTKPESMSAPGHEHMRLFKKGGHVTHHHKHKVHHHMHEGGSMHEASHERAPGYKQGGHHKHKAHHEHEGKERKRAHLHHVQKEGLHKTEAALKKESHLMHGGRVRHQRHDDRGHPHDIMGGSLTKMHIPTHKLNLESIRDVETLRKGGRAHHAHHAKHHGHRVHKAAGGTVYEQEMMGTHPSTHLKRINYEKDMVGTHPSRVPPHTGQKMKNPGALDESHGTVFRKGGKVCRGKYAAGGAAKMRKGVADSHGLPMMHKLKRGY